MPKPGKEKKKILLLRNVNRVYDQVLVKVGGAGPRQGRRGTGELSPQRSEGRVESLDGENKKHWP